jgi:hypothetical protein
MAKNKTLMTPVPTRTDKTPNRPVQATPETVTEPISERPMGVSSPKTSVIAMPFGPQNYQLMAIGVAVILIGFFIMTLDKEEFGFGFLGLTLGPLVVLSGFILEFFAILRKPKK